MKRMIIPTLVFMLCFSLAGCAKPYDSADELIEKAREEIPVSDADTIEIRYAGMCALDDEALLWFVSGNEYQAHYYLPMQVRIKGGSEYSYVRTYKPMSDLTDTAVLNWNRGYAFIVNNQNCDAVRIADETGTHEEIIEIDTYPYVFYYPSIPSGYVFIDAQANELN